MYIIILTIINNVKPGRVTIEKLEQEKSNLETKLEDQYRERAARDRHIQEIGLQVRNQTLTN